MLFKGGTLVDDRRMIQTDLRLHEDYIAQVAPGLEPYPQEKVLNCSGKLLFPGIIDAHTHFFLKSRNAVTADDAYAGSVAAAMGGVTTVIDYADPLPDGHLIEGLEKRLEEFQPAAVDYNFHFVMDESVQEKSISQLKDVQRAGITSLKLFTTYPEAGYMLPPSKWQSILRAAREYGLLVTVHGEDHSTVEQGMALQKKRGLLKPAHHPDIRPVEAESRAFLTMLDYSRKTDCPLYLVHISTRQGLEILRQGQEEGLPVYGETTPHYLLLDQSLLEGPRGALHLMTPPLRTEEHRKALWQGLAQGLLQVVATDHCAFRPEQKQGATALDILPGIPGVETLLPLLYTYGVVEGPLDERDLIACLSVNPARIFGLYPQKGSWEEGSHGDVVVYNPEGERILRGKELHSRAGYTPYEGMKVRGQVEVTVLRGNVLVEKGQFQGSRGQGQFIPGCL